MAAVLVSLPMGVEPERFWTNLGPKTLAEILWLLDNSTRLNYGMLSQKAKDAVEEALAQKMEEANAAAEAAKKKQQRQDWIDRKKAAAQRSRR